MVIRNITISIHSIQLRCGSWWVDYTISTPTVISYRVSKEYCVGDIDNYPTKDDAMLEALTRLHNRIMHLEPFGE